MTGCNPVWLKNSPDDVCPYGTKLPSEVTLPKDVGIWEVIALFYSYVPVTMIVIALASFLCRRGTRCLSLLLFTFLSMACNEVAIKLLLHQPRPGADYNFVIDGNKVGSCATSCGMPSSHATVSMGFLVLMLLDALHRVVPSPQQFNLRQESKESEFGSILKVIFSKELLNAFIVRDIMTQQQFKIFAVVWTLALLPVGSMRVLLHDHTLKQVIIGSFLGVIYGSFWFGALLTIAEKYKEFFKARIWGQKFIHDLGPIRYAWMLMYDGAEMHSLDIGVQHFEIKAYHYFTPPGSFTDRVAQPREVPLARQSEY